MKQWGEQGVSAEEWGSMFHERRPKVPEMGPKVPETRGKPIPVQF